MKYHNIIAGLLCLVPIAFVVYLFWLIPTIHVSNGSEEEEACVILYTPNQIELYTVDKDNIKVTSKETTFLHCEKETGEKFDSLTIRNIPYKIISK